MKRCSYYLSSVVLLFFPVMALAQFGPVDTFIREFSGFINGTIIPVILAIAVIVFVYGAVKFFFWKSGDEGDRKAGQQLMIYAVVGFVLIVSIWGIVRLFAEGLNLRDDNLKNVPETPSFRTTP